MVAHLNSLYFLSGILSYQNTSQNWLSVDGCQRHTRQSHIHHYQSLLSTLCEEYVQKARWCYLEYQTCPALHPFDAPENWIGLYKIHAFQWDPKGLSLETLPDLLVFSAENFGFHQDANRSERLLSKFPSLLFSPQEFGFWPFDWKGVILLFSVPKMQKANKQSVSAASKAEAG